MSEHVDNYLISMYITQQSVPCLWQVRFSMTFLPHSPLSLFLKGEPHEKYQTQPRSS